MTELTIAETGTLISWFDLTQWRMLAGRGFVCQRRLGLVLIAIGPEASFDLTTRDFLCRLPLHLLVQLVLFPVSVLMITIVMMIVITIVIVIAYRLRCASFNRFCSNQGCSCSSNAFGVVIIAVAIRIVVISLNVGQIMMVVIMMIVV